MRYAINFDKIINQFVPHYIGGRRLILMLQALISPLQKINNAFVEWAKETRIEASMTSQHIKFEWYLNRKFKKYFLNGEGNISIQTSVKLGVPIYKENSDIKDEDNILIYYESEGKDSTPLYYTYETIEINDVSFVVNTPLIDESLVTREAYISMLKYYIEKYRLTNKTYKIKFIQ